MNMFKFLWRDKNVSGAALGIAALLLCVFAPRADAQVIYGSLVGTVTDSSSAVIADATVTFNNVGTGAVRETTSNEAGLYSIQNLQAGIYDLIITASGFSTYQQGGVTINVNSVQRRDVTLQVGAVTETVIVEASTLTLQTDKADVSTEVTAKEVQDLPLPRYRNYQSLLNLVPGATPTRYQNANTDTPARGLTTNVNGVNRNSNQTKIDGTVNTLIQLPHHTAYVPAADTIEVVNISSNSFDAEQGLAAGVAVTVQTKSGTNEFHGSAFVLHENSVFGARDFFFKSSKRPKNIVNIDGFTVGGPVVKDKLFYFFGYEGTRERVAFSRLYTIPTPDQVVGDFSAFDNAHIYDPMTGDEDGRGRTLFENNTIPLSRQSAPAVMLANLLPDPNIAGTNNNFFNSATDVTNRDQYDIKMNWNRNNNHMIFGKYGIMDAQISGISGIGNGGPPGGQCLCAGGATDAGDSVVQTATIGQTIIFTPNFLYDSTYGWTRLGQVINQELRGVNWGSDVLGIPGTNGPSLNESGMPTFDVSGYDELGDADGWNPVTRHDQTPTTTHNFSWLKGAHNIRFGFDGLQHRLNMWQPGGGGPKGDIEFRDGATRLMGGEFGGTQFNSWGSFMLGLPRRYRRSLHREDATAYEFQFGFYFRDRWQVNQKLTFTYGIRWEKFPVMTRGGFRPGVESYDIDTNTITLGGVGSVPKDAGLRDSNKMFAPRIGLAYRLNDHVVIRTGYGITWDPLPMARSLRNYPIRIQQSWDAPSSFSWFSPLTVGMPGIDVPPVEAETVQPPGTASITTIEPKLLTRGYVQSWNFMVEQRLPGDFILSTGYVGTQSTRAMARLEMNASQPGTGRAGQPLNIAFGRTASTTFLNGFTSGNYHSFQLALNRRAAEGLTIKGAYTYSHAINVTDDGGGSLTFRLPEMLGRNRANASYNQPHVLQLGFMYDTPFGPGKKYFNSGPGRWIFGDWAINGRFSAFQGRQFSVTASGSALNATRSGTQTADQIKPNVEIIGTVEEWFDTSAFARVNRTTGTLADFGNTGRNILRGPGVINADISLFRDIQLSEKVMMQIRMETFNVTNTPHFDEPNGNRNSGGFGTISRSLGSSVAQDAPPRSIRFGLRFNW